MNYPMPEFSDDLRARAREAVRAAARYLGRVQIWHEWPYWTADAGRIPHDVPLDDPNGPKVLSLTWDSARSAQACVSAHKLLGDDTFMQTARRAIEYAKITQIFAPEHARHRGAHAEETPQSDHIAARDTVEAIQGFISMYAATKDPVYLARARAGADWFHDYYMDGNGYPNAYVYFRDGDRLDTCNDFAWMMMSVVALVFAQLDAILGERRYSDRIPDAMDWVLENAMEDDGSLRIHDGTHVGHHAASNGPLARCFVNDDGICVAMIACWRATGEAKYKENALRNGEWWLRTQAFPETFAAVPLALLTFLDLYRLTGDRRYLAKSEGYAERVLSMQHHASSDRLDGGFLGADGDRHKLMDPGRTISLRTTTYAMLALCKLAAKTDAEWNLSYSAFGW